MNKFGNPLDSTRRHTERKSGDTLVHWMELNLWSDTSCNLSDKTGILNWNISILNLNTGILNWNTSILNWNTSILNWNTSILNWNTSFLYYNTGNLNNFGTSFDFTQQHTERHPGPKLHIKSQFAACYIMKVEQLAVTKLKIKYSTSHVDQAERR